MATVDGTRPHHLLAAPAKRKHLNDGDVTNPKKQRVANEQTHASHYFLAHERFLSQLRPKYDIKTMSVMPSTSINKHVDKALEHLGRFNMWDQSVLPGVVFLSSAMNASNKLVTISELVRRRIGEGEQKWYQYNILNETETEVVLSEERYVVEDTFMDAPEDDYFESMEPTVHERATQTTKIKHKCYMGVLVSRTPLDELKSIPSVALQTNEDRIEALLRNRRVG